MVVRMLGDRKLEVQDLAATTLSGILKGLPPADAGALRAQFIAAAEEQFPVGRKRVRGSRENGAPTSPFTRCTLH
jgi:hypothetical protein